MGAYCRKSNRNVSQEVPGAKSTANIISKRSPLRAHLRQYLPGDCFVMPQLPDGTRICFTPVLTTPRAI